MAEIASGIVPTFDPTKQDAAEKLAALIKSHFGATPIAPPDEAQRRMLHDNFNWTKAAKKLMATVEVLCA